MCLNLRKYLGVYIDRLYSVYSSLLFFWAWSLTVIEQFFTLFSVTIVLVQFSQNSLFSRIIFAVTFLWVAMVVFEVRTRRITNTTGRVFCLCVCSWCYSWCTHTNMWINENDLYELLRLTPCSMCANVNGLIGIFPVISKWR